ncbi:MAG: hypothetical protein ACLT98_02535 [Eggerthellaceae bacterium]
MTVTLAAGGTASPSQARTPRRLRSRSTKGSNVTVEVTPDDGWFADSLTAFAGDGSEAAKLEVEDGRATFKAETDTTVTCAFYENGSNGSAALEAVATDASAKQAKQASDKAYIKANLDESLSDLDKFERRDVLTVTTTTVDSGKVAAPTLDGLWADADGDGMGDYSDALKSNAVSHAVLYDLDDSSDYLVGRAGSDISGATLADWGASENNADAAMRRGFKFDAATGLVYVPKKYTVKNKAGEYKVASSRIQLLYTTSDKGAVNTFPVKVEAENVDGRAAKSGTASVDVSSPDTQVALARDKAARKSMLRRHDRGPSPSTASSTRATSTWTPRRGHGTLDILIAAAGVRSVDIQARQAMPRERRLVARGAATGGLRRQRVEHRNLGVPVRPLGGMSFHTAGHNKYTGARTGATLPAVENPSGGRYRPRRSPGARHAGRCDVSATPVRAWSIERTCTMRRADGLGVTIPSATKVDLTCGHVGVTLRPARPLLQPGRPHRRRLRPDRARRRRQRRRGRSSAYRPDHLHAGGANSSRSMEAEQVRYTFSKCSANVSITDGNSEYSVEGAEVRHLPLLRQRARVCISSPTHLATPRSTSSPARPTTPSRPRRRGLYAPRGHIAFRPATPPGPSS